MTCALAFAGGFALALLPVWLFLRDVVRWREVDTPWGFWGFCVRDSVKRAGRALSAGPRR